MWSRLEDTQRALIILISLFLLGLLGIGIWIGTELALTARAARVAIQRLSDVNTGLIASATGTLSVGLSDLSTGVDGWGLQINDTIRQGMKTLDGRAQSVQRDVVNEVHLALNDKQQGLVPNINYTLNDPVRGLTSSVSEVVHRVDSTLETYQNLPYQISQDRVFKSYVANGLGLIAASKLTMGKVEVTADAISAAAPQFVTKWDNISDHISLMTDHSAKASDQAAIFMGNLSAATKPFPKWFRIVAGVAPPLAQTGAAVVGSGVALGWLGGRQ